MVKIYPKEITIDNIKFQKSPNEIYFELVPELNKVEADAFLNSKKEFIEWEFKPIDRQALAMHKYNKLSERTKWVTRAKGRRETIDQLISRFEKNKSVSIVAPVYFRKDLKKPNGFSLSDQIIIRLKETTSEKDLKALFSRLGVERVKGPRGELGKGLMLIRVLDKKKQNTYEVSHQIAKSNLVQAANVDMIQLHEGYTAIPNDTHFTDQWNLRNSGQIMSDGNIATVGCDINVEQAWDISKGSPLVVIAILDSGCDLTHPDLLFHYVEPDRWYDAETGTNNPFDYYRHGTCCAGVASAVTNSLTSQGVAGVGWNCRIMPVRLEGGTGFTEAKLLNSINHALNNHANVISMSWVWGGAQANMDIAFQNCVNAGIVLVAASGNSGAAFISYPASNANVIAVGATNENDWRCTAIDWGGGGGSQHGPQLSVVAPGVHTWSTDRQGAVGYDPGDYYNDFGGTSGATPHVAGLAGLILAYNPTLTPVQVRTIIENTADDLVGNPAEDVAGRDDFMGHGRINAHAALVDVQTNHPYTPADVYIRDSLTDTGLEPYTGWDLCNTPDIIIRKHAVANPQTAFVNMTVDPGSDIVEIGNDNYIYVRVHNKGTTTTNIHARVYFAPLNTTCAPDLWQYIGQADFYNVIAGTSAVSDAIVWENVPDPGSGVGHFCLIASIEGYRDPHPDPVGISNATQYMNFIKAHNNICYRNVTFEDSYSYAYLSENFLIPGIAEGETYDIRIEKGGLAQHAEVEIKLPLNVVKKPKVLMENAIEIEEKPRKRLRAFKLNAGREAVIKGAMFAPHSYNLAQLDIKFPEDANPGEEYKVVVQQIFQGKPIGAFQIMGKIADPKKVRFTGIRGAYLVHRADCKNLKETDKHMWVPLDSLEGAKSAGYDMALDCLNQSFTSEEVSYRLSRKVLYFINKVELAEYLNQAVKSKLGAAYFEAKYGKKAAKKKDYSIGINIALKILETRNMVGGFRKLEEIEAVKGLGKDNFVDLVNAFK